MTGRRAGRLQPKSAGPDEVGRRLGDPGRLHVWLFDVTARWFDALADRDVMSVEDRERAASLALPGAARALLSRRSALRLLLADYMQGERGEVKLVTAPGGKPVLLPDIVSGGTGDRTIAFSVGHSGDTYGIALAISRSVGFDIERRRSVPSAGAIARRWFTRAESDRLNGLEGDERDQAFMRLWTGKEALAKRHGAGLRLMMRGHEAELDTTSAQESGRLLTFAHGSEYTVAVASSSPIEGIVLVCPEEDPWTT